MAGDTKSNADLRRGRQPARKLKKKSPFAGVTAKGSTGPSKAKVGATGKSAPARKQLKKAAAVSIARSGERNSRKLPVVAPRTKNERDSMVGAVADRRPKVANKTAGEAIRALNDRSLTRRVLADPKLAKRVLDKDAVRAALSSSTSVTAAMSGTPVTGRERADAIKNLTSGKTTRIKKVGPFTRRQLVDEGAVVKTTKNASLPSPLRSVRYEKSAKKGSVQAKLQEQTQRADPAALKALDIVARPFYAGAAATKAAAEGKDIGKAAKRGIQGKEKASYRDALKAAGAPKIVSDVVGTGADFVLDPVNLVSAGTVSTARKAGEKAAKDAAKKGATEAGIRKARLDAMRAAEDSGKNRVGLDLKVAGKSVPGVRRVVSKKVNLERERKRAEAGKTVGGRNAVKAVNPRTRPAGVSESEFVMQREAATSARAFRDEALNETRRISRSAAKNVKKKDVPEILNAIERQDFTGLAPDLITIAGKVDKHMKTWAARRKAAGLDAEITTGYVPHMTPASLKGETMPQVQGGSAFSRTVTDHSRKDKRTIREQNDEVANLGLERKFEDEDLPLLLAAQGSKSANTVAKARFNKQLSEDAPAFKQGDKLRAGEGVYFFDQGTLKKLDSDDLVAVAKGRHKDKKLVRLNDTAYEKFIDDLKPLDRTGGGIAFDKANAAWKRLALATPGFYVRNLIGEATMGFMGTKGALGTARYTKAGLKDSPKVLRRVHQREQADLAALDPKAAPLPRTKKTIRVAGKKENLDDFIDRARADGVLRKGQQGNEIRELQDGLGDAGLIKDSKRSVKNAIPVKTRERAGSFAADIEDVWRLASYKANLDAGMSRTAARRKALDFHFDYGELSRFERQARRVLPFYTFNARALEMYTRSALMNPKKLSAIEKSRESVQDLTGADENWREGAKEYQERAVPIVAKIGGKDLMVTAGLPVSILNELPLDAIEAMGKMVRGDFAGASAAAKDQTTEWFLFSMGLLTPFVKAPIELGANHSYFFRGDIESDGRRLVAAPEYLKPLKGTAVGDLLGLSMITDKRTGQKVLGFRGKADYLLKQLPGVPAILNRLVAKGTNRRGQDPTLELIAAITGVNAQPVDKNAAAFEALYDEREKVDARMGDLRQQDKKESSEYEELNARKKELDELVGRAKIERGDADATAKKTKKVRKKKDTGLWGGGSSAGGSSGGSMWGGGSSSSSSSGSSSMWGG